MYFLCCAAQGLRKILGRKIPDQIRSGELNREISRLGRRKDQNIDPYASVVCILYNILIFKGLSKRICCNAPMPATHSMWRFVMRR